MFLIKFQEYFEKIYSCSGALRIGVLKNFANFTGKHLCWSLFYEVGRLQPASFLKRDSNASASLRSLRNV